MIGLPEVGDHLISPRQGYTHHGIYIGRERVIHYAGFVRPFKSGPVEEIALANFASGNGYFVKEYPKREFSREESVRRARTKLGEDFYDPIANNCEQFVTWCITGYHGGFQDKAFAVFAAAAVFVIGAMYLFRAFAGRSGSKMMNVLAAIGALVGLGAVGGILFVAIGLVLAVAYVLSRTIFKTNPGQPFSERTARRVGTAATALPGLLASAGIILAVSQLGIVGGLSGPGITSGLAAMGFGYMVCGIVLGETIPALGAAILACVVYTMARSLLRKYDRRPDNKLQNCHV